MNNTTYYQRNKYVVLNKAKDYYSGVSLTSWGGVSLALVGHNSSDSITRKLPYWVDILLHQPALHSICSYWVLLKLNPILLLDQLRLREMIAGGRCD